MIPMKTGSLRRLAIWMSLSGLAALASLTGCATDNAT